MNKNLPFAMVSYFLSLMLMTTMESWLGGWMLLEMNTLSFISLIVMNNKSSHMIETSITYFMVQTVSSLILINSLYFNLNMSLLSIPAMLFMSALIMKMSVGPMQAWAIPVMVNMGWSNLWLLLTAQKMMPLLMLEMSKPELSNFILTVAMITLIVGSFSNISSSHLKLMMAFSSISTMAWILIACMTSSETWKIFMTIYALTLLVVVLQPEKKNNQNKIIWTGWLSMAGIPPLMGFFPKLMILQDTISNSMILMSMILLIFSMMDLYIYYRLTHPSIMLENTAPSMKKLHKTPWLAWGMMNTMVIATL